MVAIYVVLGIRLAFCSAVFTNAKELSCMAIAFPVFVAFALAVRDVANRKGFDPNRGG